MEILVGLIFHCFDGVRRKMSTLGYVAYKADHKGTRSRRSSSSAIEVENFNIKIRDDNSLLLCYCGVKKKLIIT